MTGLLEALHLGIAPVGVHHCDRIDSVVFAPTAGKGIGPIDETRASFYATFASGDLDGHGEKRIEGYGLASGYGGRTYGEATD